MRLLGYSGRRGSPRDAGLHPVRSNGDIAEAEVNALADGDAAIEVLVMPTRSGTSNPSSMILLKPAQREYEVFSPRVRAPSAFPIRTLSARFDRISYLHPDLSMRVRNQCVAQ
jgi:hypothetical protein